MDVLLRATRGGRLAFSNKEHDFLYKCLKKKTLIFEKLTVVSSQKAVQHVYSDYYLKLLCTFAIFLFTLPVK